MTDAAYAPVHSGHTVPAAAATQFVMKISQDGRQVSKGMDHATSMRRSLRFARRVIVKVGTTTVTHVDGNIALGRVAHLCEQIAQLRHNGHEVVVVTSGAIGTGAARMRRNLALSKPLRDSVSNDGPKLRLDQNASAALGQALLMNLYESLLSKYNLSCAQVLVTADDMADPLTLAQARDTITELLHLGAIPVVNENDAVTGRTIPVLDEATNEVVYDNDELACQLAAELRADLVVFLTDMDGLFTRKTPKAAPERISLYSPGTPVIAEGMTFDSLTRTHSSFEKRSRSSIQGLEVLVQEAQRVTASGLVRAAVVTSGHHPVALLRVMRGEDVGTLFTAAPAPASKL